MFFTWSHTNSSSETSSRASGEGEAYLCIVLIRVDMYLRFASVRERLDCAFHASLYSRQPYTFQTVFVVSCVYHFSLALFADSSDPSGLSIMPSTSPSMTYISQQVFVKKRA